MVVLDEAHAVAPVLEQAAEALPPAVLARLLGAGGGGAPAPKAAS